jgi:hypothetical protein
LGVWEVFVGDGLEPFAQRLFLAYSIAIDNLIETVENEEADEPSPVPDPWNEFLEGPSVTARQMLSAPHWWLLWFAFWPTTWVAWAGLTRGGLVRRLLGIALVDQNGHPAARWRCAWRALMIWFPVMLLLCGSLFFDLLRIAYGAEWDDGFLTFLAWSAWGVWCLALILLPLYTYRGVSGPRRGLHDRLAGIYPVPG